MISGFLNEEYVADPISGSLISTVANRTICVPQIEIPTQFYAFVKIKGIARAILDGVSNGTIGVETHLQLRKEVSRLQKIDTFKSGSCGISLEIVTVASQVATIFLEGVKVTINVL